MTGTTGDSPPNRQQATVSVYIVVALLGTLTLGTIWYLSTEEDSGWDGVFLWTSIAFGWAFVTVAFNNLQKSAPSRAALWSACGLYALFGFGALLAITAYWLAAEDEIYPITVVLVLGTAAIVTSTVYAVTMIIRQRPVAVPAAPAAPAHAAPSAGWHPDPAGAHQFRFFDGERWTSRVRDGDLLSQDPL